MLTAPSGERRLMAAQLDNVLEAVRQDKATVQVYPSMLVRMPLRTATSSC